MRKQPERDGKKLNNVIMILFVLILVAVLIIVVALALKRNSSAKVTQAESTERAEQDTSAGEKWQEGVVSYNGKRYRYNNAIKTYLFMGVDQEGPVEAAKDGISGGQSDAMFLLVTDQKAKTLSVIGINRNTMTDVDVYDEDGSYVGRYQLQICLQHGYGDGMRTSCLRAVDAVSRLFYNLPISGYLSMNMGGMPAMNDAVGGVTLEVMDDLENESKGVSLKKGETVTLNGDEAYVYLRSRDCDEFDSASRRLERQEQYLIAFLAQAKNSGQNEASITKVYNSISEYMVTSMDFAKLASDALDYGFDASRMYTIPGETVMGEQFEEYYVDEDALYQMILDIFYEPVE